MATYYAGKGQGAWIKDMMIEAGNKGIVIADLFKERHENWLEIGLPHRGTYNSFAKYFYWFNRAGWIEFTGKTEPSSIRNTNRVLNPNIPRKYFRITNTGESYSDEDWSDPLKKAAECAIGKSYYPRNIEYIPTGRRVGRPKLSD